jgi:hypothetical protein
MSIKITSEHLGRIAVVYHRSRAILKANAGNMTWRELRRRRALRR